LEQNIRSTGRAMTLITFKTASIGFLTSTTALCALMVALASL
jgi:hypothetical protein